MGQKENRMGSGKGSGKKVIEVIGGVLFVVAVAVFLTLSFAMRWLLNTWSSLSYDEIIFSSDTSELAALTAAGWSCSDIMFYIN